MAQDYDSLTTEARIARIAELCSKAVTLFLLSQTADAEQEARAQLNSRFMARDVSAATPAGLSDDAIAVLVYLRRVGTASPENICQYTDLSHSTVTRRLRELLRRSMVARTGKTRAVQYAIASAPATIGTANPEFTTSEHQK